MTPIERQLYDALERAIKMFNDIHGGQMPLPHDFREMLQQCYDAINAADEERE